ncbi:unnamed protein product [Discosporangium mesarthrocarpum]
MTQVHVRWHSRMVGYAGSPVKRALSSGSEQRSLLANVEKQIDQLILCLQPCPQAEDRRQAVFERVRRVVLKSLPSAEVFPAGSFPLKTYLPCADVDMVLFVPPEGSGRDFILQEGLVETPLVERSERETYPGVPWGRTSDGVEGLVQMNTALCNASLQGGLDRRGGSTSRRGRGSEGSGHSPELEIRSVSFVNARTPMVTMLVGNTVVDMTANRGGSIAAAALLEEADRFIRHGHLFKRSLLLVKAWMLLETPRLVGRRVLGGKDSGLTSYALSILVLQLFYCAPVAKTLQHPVDVLLRFFQVYSAVEWERTCLTLTGPVPIEDTGKTSPSNRPQRGTMPRLWRLVDKVQLQACNKAGKGVKIQGGKGSPGRGDRSSAAKHAWPHALDRIEMQFRHCNIQDPFNPRNNLGYSVSHHTLKALEHALHQGLHHLQFLLAGGAMLDPLPGVVDPIPPLRDGEDHRQNVPEDVQARRRALEWGGGRASKVGVGNSSPGSAPWSGAGPLGADPEGRPPGLDWVQGAPVVPYLVPVTHPHPPFHVTYPSTSHGPHQPAMMARDFFMGGMLPPFPGLVDPQAQGDPRPIQPIPGQPPSHILYPVLHPNRTYPLLFPLPAALPPAATGLGHERASDRDEPWWAIRGSWMNPARPDTPEQKELEGHHSIQGQGQGQWQGQGLGLGQGGGAQDMGQGLLGQWTEHEHQDKSLPSQPRRASRAGVRSMRERVRANSPTASTASMTASMTEESYEPCEGFKDTPGPADDGEANQGDPVKQGVPGQANGSGHGSASMGQSPSVGDKDKQAEWFLRAFFPRSFKLYASGDGFREDLLDHPCQQWSSRQCAKNKGKNKEGTLFLKGCHTDLYAALRCVSETSGNSTQVAQSRQVTGGALPAKSGLDEVKQQLEHGDDAGKLTGSARTHYRGESPVCTGSNTCTVGMLPACQRKENGMGDMAVGGRGAADGNFQRVKCKDKEGIHSPGGFAGAGAGERGQVNQDVIKEDVLKAGSRKSFAACDSVPAHCPPMSSVRQAAEKVPLSDPTCAPMAWSKALTITSTRLPDRSHALDAQAGKHVRVEGVTKGLGEKGEAIRAALSSWGTVRGIATIRGLSPRGARVYAWSPQLLRQRLSAARRIRSKSLPNMVWGSILKTELVREGEKKVGEQPFEHVGKLTTADTNTCVTTISDAMTPLEENQEDQVGSSGGAAVQGVHETSPMTERAQGGADTTVGEDGGQGGGNIPMQGLARVSRAQARLQCKTTPSRQPGKERLLPSSFHEEDGETSVGHVPAKGHNHFKLRYKAVYLALVGVLATWYMSSVGIPLKLLVGETEPQERGHGNVVLGLSTHSACKGEPPPPPAWVRLGLNVSIGDTAKSCGLIGEGKSIFQWNRDGVDITGVTQSFLTIMSTDGDDEGTYICSVSTPSMDGRYPGETSNCAKTGVRTSEPPRVKELLTQCLLLGDAQAITFTTGGMPHLEFQWPCNGVPLPGATLVTYLRHGAAEENMGTYTCAVYDMAGGVQWEEMVVDVEDEPT